MSTPENIAGRMSPSTTLAEGGASVCAGTYAFGRNARTLAEQALAVMDAEHTPEQLEAAIKAQGDLVEWFHMCGKLPAAREAFAHVKVLVAMRTPETVAAMDRARGLA